MEINTDTNVTEPVQEMSSNKKWRLENREKKIKYDKEYYEKTKLKKFRDSSKLEGIVVDFPDESISLESILAKHQR